VEIKVRKERQKGKEKDAAILPPSPLAHVGHFVNTSPTSLARECNADILTELPQGLQLSIRQ
jgi:hypothetical protein